jgi:hypothetical protein
VGLFASLSIPSPFRHGLHRKNERSHEQGKDGKHEVSRPSIHFFLLACCVEPKEGFFWVLFYFLDETGTQKVSLGPLG